MHRCTCASAQIVSHLCGFSPVIHPFTTSHGSTVHPGPEITVLNLDSLTEGQPCAKEKWRRVSGWALSCNFTTIWGVSRACHTSNKADWPLPEKLLRSLAKRILNIYQGFVLVAEGALGQYHTYAEQTPP